MQGYKGLQGFTRWFKEVTGGYNGLHNRGLQGLTGSYRGLQGINGRYKGLQTVTSGYRRF